LLKQTVWYRKEESVEKPEANYEKVDKKDTQDVEGTGRSNGVAGILSIAAKCGGGGAGGNSAIFA
jgi:hypothetical protein